MPDQRAFRSLFHRPVTVLFALTLAVSAQPAWAQEPGASSLTGVPVVVTVGEAVIMAVPDRADVMITAESRSRNSADAQRQNAELMTSVQQKLQQAGIAKDAIRTVGYDLQPEFEYSNGRQIPRGYVVRNSIEVRLDDVTRVGAVVDVAGTAGATSIGAIRFDVRNREALERDALRQAVANARARADAAAAGAGRAIDRVVRIEEGGSPEIPRPMMRIAAAEAAATPIAPSTLEIRARVTLTAVLR
jgi:uncharacterized protein YggE